MLFSATEPKVQAHFCAHVSSVVGPLSVVTIHIFDWTKFNESNVLYQVGVFRADRENKMAALASDCLRHFWLLVCNS